MIHVSFVVQSSYSCNEATCILACPAGMFGERCSRQCTCLPGRESSPCDGVDGSCHCLPGYTGSSCEQGWELVY